MRARESLLVVAALAATLAACDGVAPSLESEADAKAKATLVGIWFSKYEEVDDAPDQTVTVHGWLTLDPDGKWKEQFRGYYPDGRIASGARAGSWFVTDGVFKLRVEWLNGNNVHKNDLDALYPYKLVSFAPDCFIYADPFDSKKSITGIRVDVVGKEP